MYRHACVRIYTYIYIYTNTLAHIYGYGACMYIFTYIHIYIYMCVCTYVCTNMYTNCLLSLIVYTHISAFRMAHGAASCRIYSFVDGVLTKLMLGGELLWPVIFAGKCFEDYRHGLLFRLSFLFICCVWDSSPDSFAREQWVGEGLRGIGCPSICQPRRFPQICRGSPFWRLFGHVKLSS